ncbi:hypothetical protein SKAU_G00295230 [Synaphobranchus kaupii]|uniref:Uncharacterized protein n=1 Tax=Synaphobranchus kaupii TaxID=118154 RepID=A0A9Q1EUL8_SYNKA|nr:hypothetical protein SKAU_G00295230 [Synaphobranchus kaupii]
MVTGLVEYHSKRPPPQEGPCRDGAEKTPQVTEECVLLRRLLLGLEKMESRMDRMEEHLKEMTAMFSRGEGSLAQPQVQEEEERGKGREEEEVGNEKVEEGGEKGVERRKERVEEEEKGEVVNEKNEEEKDSGKRRKKGRSVWKTMKVKWQRKRREEEGGGEKGQGGPRGRDEWDGAGGEGSR